MKRRRLIAPWLAAAALAGLAAPAPAYLFWVSPVIPSGPVTGTEPGLMLPLPAATPAEVSANLLWSMRAGLNVAALQCQFAPGLLTVHYYNDILRYHAAELGKAQTVLIAYFKRVAGKSKAAQASAATAFDAYNTSTYNGFSTYLGQFGFCETAAAIDRDAMSRPRGKLADIAVARMRELRSSQVPVGGDMAFAYHPDRLPPVELPVVDPVCNDKKGRLIDCATGRKIKPQQG